MLRPMTVRSPPRRCCHSSWLMITTCGAPYGLARAGKGGPWRLHAQDVQEVIASLNAEDPLGRARAGQVHAWSAHVGDASEDVVLVVIRHVGGRYAAAVVGIVALVLVERHQPFRVRIRQRAQQHGVDDAEDGAVHSDSQGERDYGDDGES